MRAAVPIALMAALLVAACSDETDTVGHSAINTIDALNAGVVDVDVDAEPDFSDILPPLPDALQNDANLFEAPITEAKAIDAAIRARKLVRLRHEGGWAWQQDGAIVRTADLKKRHLAYFRAGTAHPFLVRDKVHAYAFDGEKPIRQYDRGGGNRAPDAQATLNAKADAKSARELYVLMQDLKSKPATEGNNEGAALHRDGQTAPDVKPAGSGSGMKAAPAARASDTSRSMDAVQERPTSALPAAGRSNPAAHPAAN